MFQLLLCVGILDSLAAYALTGTTSVLKMISKFLLPTVPTTNEISDAKSTRTRLGIIGTYTKELVFMMHRLQPSGAYDRKQRGSVSDLYKSEEVVEAT
jgi:hypothetical protein